MLSVQSSTLPANYNVGRARVLQSERGWTARARGKLRAVVILRTGMSPSCVGSRVELS